MHRGIGAHQARTPIARLPHDIAIYNSFKYKPRIEFPRTAFLGSSCFLIYLLFGTKLLGCGLALVGKLLPRLVVAEIDYV